MKEIVVKITDSNQEVRSQSRESFLVLNSRWPAVGASIVETMDITTKKQVDALLNSKDSYAAPAPSEQPKKAEMDRRKINVLIRSRDKENVPNNSISPNKQPVVVVTPQSPTVATLTKVTAPFSEMLPNGSLEHPLSSPDRDVSANSLSDLENNDECPSLSSILKLIDDAVASPENKQRMHYPLRLH